jgi:hypothetical protein
MTIELMRTRHRGDDSIHFQQTEGLLVYLVGAAVLFASLGLGEAVYRLVFSDFDGARDRLPIEALFGLVLGWLVTKLARNVYRQQKQTTAKLNLIWDRNHRIRYALEAISPLAHPSTNQQSIRVIREEVIKLRGRSRTFLPRRTPFEMTEKRQWCDGWRN